MSDSFWQSFGPVCDFMGQVFRESPGWGEFDGDSGLAATCTYRLGEGRVQERNKMAQKAAAPALTLKQTPQLLPMPLKPFKLQTQLWNQSERVCQW